MKVIPSWWGALKQFIAIKEPNKKFCAVSCRLGCLTTNDGLRNGSQFVSREWRMFATRANAGDIRTRVAHPESNARLERLHRTHREEGLIDEDLSDYAHSIDAMTRWHHSNNDHRPHSALRYPRPVDYYRDDPEGDWPSDARSYSAH